MIEVGTHDEPLPADAEVMQPTRRVRFRTPKLVDAARPELARLSGWSSPGVRVENLYAIREGALEQLAWLSAPWWVDPFVERTFVEAHRRLLEAASR